MVRMLYANGHDSDMFYEVGVFIPDAFFFLDFGDKKYVFLDHREFEVFKQKNKNSKIEAVLLNPFIDKAAKLDLKISMANKLAFILLNEYKLLDEEYIEVSVRFPLDMADFLRSKGVNLKPVDPFCFERSLKNNEEIKAIKQSLKGVYQVYDRIKEVLAGSKIKGEELFFGTTLVTSEFLKKESDKILLENDMLNVEGIIISCGSDAAIPHHMGAGVIRPHSTIICDVFPQNRSTKYFADLTRTFVKGSASDEIMRMYQSVLKSQEEGIKAVKPGIKGKDVHAVCSQVFLDDGYDVGDKGFIHGTGHGLGIDVHEGPYLNKISEDVLKPRNVVTVEPGLYYPEFGGIRIEDDILVTEDGHENLTDYPKDMIIE